MVSEPEFEKEVRIVGMYIDTAKSYSQLATGALALAAFVGGGRLLTLDGWLLAGSVCFLVALLSGGLYQALAVGRLEHMSGLPVERGQPIPDSWRDNAYLLYNALMLFFHLGAVLFGISLIVRFVAS